MAAVTGCSDQQETSSNITAVIRDPGMPAARSGAKGEITNFYSGNGFVNIDVVVKPADARLTVVPAVAEALAGLKAKVDANELVPTTGEKQVTAMVTMIDADGKRHDFGNIMLPLVPLMTAPKEQGAGLLNVATKLEAGTGPGFDAASAWCAVPSQRQQAARFCRLVDGAA
jgi:hypothetical protein